MQKTGLILLGFLAVMILFVGFRLAHCGSSKPGVLPESGTYTAAAKILSLQVNGSIKVDGHNFGVALTKPISLSCSTGNSLLDRGKLQVSKCVQDALQKHNLKLVGFTYSSSKPNVLKLHFRYKTVVPFSVTFSKS